MNFLADLFAKFAGLSDRAIHAGGGIRGRVILIAADQPKCLGACVFGEGCVVGDGNQAADICIASGADHGVEDAEIDRPCGLSKQVGGGREVSARALDVVVVDRLDCFHGDGEIGVLEEHADAGIRKAPECEDDRAANRRGFVFCKCEDSIRIADEDHALDRSVADVFVPVVVFLHHRHESGDFFLCAEFSCGDGGEHPGAGVGIAEEGDDGGERRLMPGVAESLHRLAADFRVLVGAKFHKSLCRAAVLFQTSEVAESPNTVETGGDGFIDAHCVDENGAVRRVFSECELRPEPHPHIGMAEKRGELCGFQSGETLRKQAADAFRILFRRLGGIFEAEDVAFFKGGPASDVFRDVSLAVVAELNVGAEHSGNKVFLPLYLESRAVRFHAESDHRAGRADEIANEEMVVPFFREAGAGIVGEAGGAFADPACRGEDGARAKRAVHVPVALPHPVRIVAAGAVDEVREFLERLMPALPTGMRAFHHVYDAGHILHVRFVIDGKQISVAVEGDLLGIPQTRVHDLKVAAVALHAEHSALVLAVEMAAFLGFQVVAAVADGEPDPVVRP